MPRLDDPRQSKSRLAVLCLLKGMHPADKRQPKMTLWCPQNRRHRLSECCRLSSSPSAVRL